MRCWNILASSLLVEEPELSLAKSCLRDFISLHPWAFITSRDFQLKMPNESDKLGNFLCKIEAVVTCFSGQTTRWTKLNFYFLYLQHDQKIEQIDREGLCILFPNCLKRQCLISAFERIDGLVSREERKMTKLIRVHWVGKYLSLAVEGPAHERLRTLPFQPWWHESIFLITKMKSFFKYLKSNLCPGQGSDAFTCYQIERRSYSLNIMFDKGSLPLPIHQCSWLFHKFHQQLT